MFHHIDNDKREHEVQSAALQPYYPTLQHSISAYLLLGMKVMYLYSESDEWNLMGW